MPKSKYQTDQGLKEYANAPYPQLKMDRASSSPDGNKVIELANQIVLPPIREQMDSQQSQRVLQRNPGVGG